VLYISHRLGDIGRLADRIVVLRNGRRVAEQVKPVDLAAAVRAMIGRSLDKAVRAAGQEQTNHIVLSMTGVRLVSGASCFDLAVRAGEVVAVTGALGAGKSRLLRALFGIESIERDPSRWTERLGGRPGRPTPLRAASS
jgi:simple sugar transport system ATP-binding protein